MLPEMLYGTKIATDLPFSSTEKLLENSFPVITKSTKRKSDSKAGKAKTAFTSSEKVCQTHTVLKSITSSSLETRKTILETVALNKDIGLRLNGRSSSAENTRDGSAKTKWKSDGVESSTSVGHILPMSASWKPTTTPISSKHSMQIEMADLTQHKNTSHSHFHDHINHE